MGHFYLFENDELKPVRGRSTPYRLANFLREWIFSTHARSLVPRETLRPDVLFFRVHTSPLPLKHPANSVQSSVWDRSLGYIYAVSIEQKPTADLAGRRCMISSRQVREHLCDLLLEHPA